MNPTAKSLLAILVVLGLGSVLWYRVAVPPEDPPAAPLRDLGPIPVEIRDLSLAELELSLEVYGTLEARRRAFLVAEVPGRVATVLEDWQPGRAVRAGELLVELDATDLELDIRAARARLAEAEARRREGELGRTQAARSLENARAQLALAVREDVRQAELAATGHASARSVDQAQAALLDAQLAHEAAQLQSETSAAVEAALQALEEGARSALARAEREREKARLQAPFPGLLRGHPPAVGTLVQPGVTLGELIDPDSLVLVARVPATELASLAPGRSAFLYPANEPELGGGPGTPGEVRAVDPTVDPVTRRARVEIQPRVLAPQGSDARGGPTVPLTPGAFARADIDLGTVPGLWIARNEFTWASDGPVAFVLSAEGTVPRAERRPLVFEREHGEGFVVRSGLAAGDRLLVHPLERLFDGAPVRPGGNDPR